MRCLAAHGGIQLPQPRLVSIGGGVGSLSSCRWKTNRCLRARNLELWRSTARHWNGKTRCQAFWSADSSSSSIKSESENFGQRKRPVLEWVVPAVLAAATIVLALRSGRAFAATFEKNVAREASTNQLGIALVSAWAGLIAGGLHTLTGPDHLAALAPLCIGRRSKLESAAVGAVWGCGHDAGQVLFGFFFLLLKDRLKIEVLRTWGARVVGLTLIAIGAVGIKEAQESPAVEEEAAVTKKKSLGFTFATGIVYGLQPDALLMILPALAMPSGLAGVSFLAMFLVGTVAAMSSYTVFLGSCSQALHEKIPWITRKLSWASSIVAIAFGFAVLAGEIFGLSFY
ncbi:uncharacterized protein LOC9631074 [Selaginella moellendorffii]|uniref:uncharacterized protein LOC9631074 n=1 Tax=Selaginella moellendorffii TaxID=88036 RepID=UPI000D1CE014|nr:uncharacterized protein LOC9631074 [Selaginella moellendorffii]|eukprot:XP_002967987.2 uncharacterized protein LOC9631074 [Selaginella moellendorffii]